MRCERDAMHSWKSGITDTKIMMEIQKEQIGSAMCQSMSIINDEDIMTLTLPKKSAKTCNPIPDKFAPHPEKHLHHPCDFGGSCSSSPSKS